MAFNKQKALKTVNPIVGILFVVQAGSGIFHDAIGYGIFHKLHGPVGYAFTVGLIVHIWLNWSWFRTAFKKKKQ